MSKLVNMLGAMRSYLLRRDLKTIEKTLSSFTPKQRQQIAQIVVKELAEIEQTQKPHPAALPAEMYAPWGNGTQQAMERIKSSNQQLKMRGVAMWLIVAYSETRLSDVPAITQLHRKLISLYKQLKTGLSKRRPAKSALSAVEAA